MSGPRIPALTTAQMVEVDRLMVEEYGITLIQMMENAGRSLAELARRLLGGRVRGSRVAVLCGAGNNGGGGLVAARHLNNWGAEVGVTLTAPPARLNKAPAQQWIPLALLPVSRRIYSAANPPALDDVDLVLDALIGYGLLGNPRGAVAELIHQANATSRLIVALDTPSGLDATTGTPATPCIRASATLTLALPKAGLLTKEAQPVVGDLYLADISVPPALYARLGIEPPYLFGEDTLIRLR